MIQFTEILPGVRLRCIQTDRFKSSCLSISLLRPLRQEEAAYNALLANVLMQGTRLHPDLQSLSLALDELYGTSLGPVCRKNGEIQTVGFYMSCLDDRYAISGDRVLEPAIQLLSELLLDPFLVEGCFSPDYVALEKENLVNTIASAINDKRTYTSMKMLEAMCAGDCYAVPRLGTVEDVEAITPEGLYRHYRNILATSQIEIFYGGSRSGDELASLLTHALAALPRGALRETSFGVLPRRPIPQYLQEAMDIAQGKLSMGFTTQVTTRDPEYPASVVFNALFGGEMTSKLFLNVREKLSLCYYASSNLISSKGIMTVSCGIDTGNYQKAVDEILRQLQLCADGEITCQELSAAKQAILSSLSSLPDSISGMEDFSAFQVLSGFTLTRQAYMDAVAAVTIQDVAAIAAGVRLDTIYFLKGVSQ